MTTLDELITVRVSDLRPGHQVLVDGVFLTVRGVEPGHHKDALVVRLRQHKPLVVSWDDTIQALQPPLPHPDLEQRRLEFNRRCGEAARVYMRATYGVVDFTQPEWHTRLAHAFQGAARELARTGRLVDLGIERPAQVTKVRCKVTYVEQGAADNWTHFRVEFEDTDLATPPPRFAPEQKIDRQDP